MGPLSHCMHCRRYLIAKLSKFVFQPLLLVQMGGKEPGVNREPGKIKHPDLTGMSDGHAETSQSCAE
jgi:hypothetical protein